MLLRFVAVSVACLTCGVCGLRAGGHAGAGGPGGGFGAEVAWDDFGDAVHPGEVRWFSASFYGAKLTMEWAVVEKTAGKYDFQAYAGVIADLSSWGRGLVVTLHGDNLLYDGGVSPASPAAVSAFAKFAVAAVQRFANKGVVWEIWCEPNVDGPASGQRGWTPKPDASAYARLAEAAAIAVHTASATEAVAGLSLGSLCSTSSSSLTPDASSCLDAAFLTNVLQAVPDVLAHWDGVSFHFLGYARPEASEPDLRLARDILANHTKHSLSFSPTSSSSSSSSSSSRVSLSAPPPVLCTGIGGISADNSTTSQLQQALYLARSRLFHLAVGVNLSVWVSWRDTLQQHDGVVGEAYHNSTIPFDAKLSFAAANNLVACTADLTLLAVWRRAVTDSVTCFVLYWDGGFMTTFYTAWCDAPDGWSTTLVWPETPPSAAAATATATATQASGVCIQSYDLLGRALGLVCADNGAFKVDLGNSPIYLRDLRA